MRASRPMSNTSSSNRLSGFRSPKIRPTSPDLKSKEAPLLNYLSSPKFEKLHDNNKNGLGFFIDKDNERQKMRKENNNFSNLIDNYYNSEIHPRSWWPNGGLIIKRRYKYTGIGLDHFYEKNNVEQLETVEDIKLKEKKDVDYLVKFQEFENIKYNEYMITIEHCASCQEHKYITQHQSDTIFKELALSYQKIIRERFPFIKVYLKPIDVEIVKNKTFVIPKVERNGGPRPKIPSLNTKFKQCRIGAFEIQIATRDEKGNLIQRIIHSKLKTKKFPDVNTVLKKIVSFMPKFKLKLILFDKEDYEEIEKMDNIQVNLYLCNSKLIQEVTDTAKMQVLNFTSPTRRLLMMKEQRFKLQQQNFMKNKNIFRKKQFFSPLSTQRITSAAPKKTRGMTENNSTKMLRPISSMSYNFNDKFYENNKLKQNPFWLKSENVNNRELKENRLSFSTMEATRRICKDINIQEKLKKQKGALIKRKYSKVDESYKYNEQNLIDDDKNDEDAETSESVTLYFDDIPYDTYIIETIENSNFRGSLTLLRFNEIKPNKEHLITKYIGLWHQEKAILNIHLYTEKEKSYNIAQNNGIENNYNSNIIMPNQERRIRPPSSNQRRRSPNQENNSEIRYEQEPILTGSINISNAEDPNSRYKVHPNGNGIYEYKTTPGEYKLEVTNKDYEKIVMKVLLKSGLNTINIKMKQEKGCNLKIQVFEYNEYPENDSNNYYLMNNPNELEPKKENKETQNENQGEEEKNSNMNKNPEDNIYIEPVRNAEIEIYKEGNELLVEGITNKKGVMKYLVDKNENNLLIKVSKSGYYRVERVFKRNNSLKENEKGNYECTMTFILVKIQRIMELNKIILISYSNTLKKIFEFDVQNVDEEKNKWIEKDMQETHGVFIATFNYEDQLKENEENQIDENDKTNKLLMENNNISNSNNNNNQNEIGKSHEDMNDFNENITFEEIIRLGFRISLDIIKDEYMQSYDAIRQNDSDLIDYLRSICSDGNIYTPNYDFHINLPKVLSKGRITPKFMGENDNEENMNINSDITNNINSNSFSKTINNKNNLMDDKNEEFTGLYWDLGWIDLKNYLFYETSVYFKLEYKPERCLFFENFIDFLQIFIDQRICDSIFNFFNYEMSILAGSDRYLPKKIFESKLFYILDEDNRNNRISEQMKSNNSKSNSNKFNQKQIQLQKFVQFICNILCGYDEDNNIKDDSISFSLLRKKVSSNLQNFLNYSSDGKKESIKSTEQNLEE